ncbi:hypothetical protein ACP8Z6_24785, partial [Escherichia coli]
IKWRTFSTVATLSGTDVLSRKSGAVQPRIRELRAEMSGEMLVLVPERLEMLKVLRNICPVQSF